MEVIKVSSWSEYVQAIEKVKEAYSKYQYPLGDGKIFEEDIRILYRGQANKGWSLDTTLERKTDRKMHTSNYMYSACNNAQEIESFTEKNWGVPDYPDIESSINEKQTSSRVHLPCYDYLVYLRHHGFPSPLLDWSESPFIAAYFAYYNSNKSDVAVYCYIERPGPSKGGIIGRPQISVMGPYVRTHKRHYAQKAWYTIATQWNREENKHYFVHHENVFDKEDKTQDLLIKIELPGSIRKSALNNMNEYNINHFTLFQSEDSLIKSIEMKEFDQCYSN